MLPAVSCSISILSASGVMTVFPIMATYSQHATHLSDIFWLILACFCRHCESLDMGSNAAAELQPGLSIWCCWPLLVRWRSNHPDHPLRNPGRSNQDESALSTHGVRDRARPLGECSTSGLLLLLLPDQHHCQRYVDPWRGRRHDCPDWNEHYCGKLDNHLTCLVVVV